MTTATEVLIAGRDVVALLIRNLEHDDDHDAASCGGCAALHAGRAWIKASHDVRTRATKEQA